MSEARAIVVGLGGAAAGDDAVGLAVAHAVAARGVEARTAADASLVLALLEAGRRVIVVDAVVGGGAAGTVHRLDPAALARGPAPLSSHGLGVADALDVARALGLPALASLSIIGVAIEPPGPAPVLSLSPAVAAAVAPAADLALALAAAR